MKSTGEDKPKLMSSCDSAASLENSFEQYIRIIIFYREGRMRSRELILLVTLTTGEPILIFVFFQICKFNFNFSSLVKLQMIYRNESSEWACFNFFELLTLNLIYKYEGWRGLVLGKRRPPPCRMVNGLMVTF